jgi:hypothetical protein
MLYSAESWTANDELVMMWKEAAVAYLTYFPTCAVGTEKNHERNK